MTADLPKLPEPLKQVAVAGYHDGVLKDALEDYYDADQVRAYAQEYAAALSAQGEAVAWQRRDLLTPHPQMDVGDRWSHWREIGKDEFDCLSKSPFPYVEVRALYTAPGGVGDAVTEADIDIMRDVYMTRAQHEAYQRILLAARSGKGEANG